MAVVSVVIPVYNAGERLRATLDSVRRQTYPDFEVVCVDDGSSDQVTARILDEYAASDGRFRVVHQENSGPDSAQDVAMRASSGEYIVRCDQDDIMHQCELEYCVAAARRFDLDFLSFRYRPFVGNPPMADGNILDGVSRLQVWTKERQKEDPAGYRAALKRIHSDTWSHFVRRELTLSAPLGADYEFTRPFHQVMYASRWASTPDVLYYYRKGDSSAMSHAVPKIEGYRNKRLDLLHLYDLYYGVRGSGDVYGEWETVSERYMASRIKHLWNKLRRTRKCMTPELYAALFEEWLCSAWEVFDRMGVSMHILNFRLRIRFRWLIWWNQKIIEGYKERRK